MKPNSIYPVIGVEKVDESRDFYTRYFDFEITFEADWYVSLKHKKNPAYELALLDYHHPSLPEAYRKPAQGVLINVEVENVDKLYEVLKEAGLPIDLELKSEGWGQRHFITHDPHGILIDVIQNIPPQGEFADQYT